MVVLEDLSRGTPVLDPRTIESRSAATQPLTLTIYTTVPGPYRRVRTNSFQPAMMRRCVSSVPRAFTLFTYATAKGATICSRTFGLTFSAAWTTTSFQSIGIYFLPEKIVPIAGPPLVGTGVGSGVAGGVGWPATN